MDFWNAPSLLGDDVKNVRSSLKVHTPEKKIYLKTMESTISNIDNNIIEILKYFRVNIDEEKLLTYRKAFPFFNTISPEIWSFAYLFHVQRIDSKDWLSVIKGNVKNEPSLFPQMEEIIKKSQEGKANLQRISIDIKRYIDRIKTIE